MSSVRRLAAILAADVAGYSRLMGADEERTHEQLKAHLGELVNPKIAEHRGRIVKNTGDGFLAELIATTDWQRISKPQSPAPRPGSTSLPHSFSSGDWQTHSTTYAILIQTLRLKSGYSPRHVVERVS